MGKIENIFHNRIYYILL